MHLAFDTYTLDNGLRVIHHSVPSVAKAVVNVLYRVGAKNEDENRTGFAHLFEHLMFEGSKNVAHFDVHVERAGGESNAYTTNDITNYYIQLPANQLETALWLESDRMLELDFSQQKLDVQKSVVCEEFKQRYLNQPYGDAYLHLRPLMFTTHPYKWMTIGKSLEQIEAATLDQVKDFFFHFYAPNNATLVIAGGVTLSEGRHLVEKWFGGIPSRDVRKPLLPHEPPQTAPRQATVSASNVPLPQVYKAYHIPARASAEYPAAEIWSELLAGGKNAWLYQRLVVEKKVAAAIGAFSWGLYDTGQFSLNAQLTEGTTTELYEEALAEAMEDLARPDGDGGLTAEHLRRQIVKHEATETFDRATILSRAQALATYDSFASPDWINTELDRYRTLTLAEMQEFRERYFSPNNCTTLNYLPE